MIKKDTKIYIAGHRGMVGSAVWRALESKGYTSLLGKTSAELDLRNQQAVLDFYVAEKPTLVIDAAARVGGILANSDFPYQFLMENMQIQKVNSCSWVKKTQKLVLTDFVESLEK